MVRARGAIRRSHSRDEDDEGDHDENDANNDDDDERPAVEMTVAGSHHIAEPVMDVVADTTRRALHRFFYPSEGKKLKKGVRVQASEEELKEEEAEAQHDNDAAAAAVVVLEEQQAEQRGVVVGGASALSSPTSTAPISRIQQQQSPSAPNEPLPTPTDHNHRSTARSNYDPRTRTADQDRAFVHNFWTTYDDIVILSIFTQLGVLFRLASSSWFAKFDNVFANDSPLFVNLPLNCLSCFVLGLLGSGERLLEIIHTRFAPPRTQQSMQCVPPIQMGASSSMRGDDYDENDNEMMPIITEENSGGIEEDGRSRRRNHNNGNQQHSLPTIHHMAPPYPRSTRRRRRRRPKKQKQSQQSQSQHFVSWQPPVHLNEELRDVQLLALERRIRMSKCLLLFPVSKQDVDVMEHYFGQGYKKDQHHHSSSHDDNYYYHDGDNDESYDLALRESSGRSSGSSSVMSSIREEDVGDVEEQDQDGMIRTTAADALAQPPESEGSDNVPLENGEIVVRQPQRSRPLSPTQQQDSLTGSLENVRQRSPLGPSTSPRPPSNNIHHHHNPDDDDSGEDETTAGGDDDGTMFRQEENPDILAEFTTNVQENVQEHVDRLRRVNLADGWDAGTSAEEMSDDLMLGLRDGFCGALSSFSSWNNAMVSMIRNGQVGEALVGYMIGLQLPIIAYRFGQHVAVYVFIWRTRRETRKDERRGYGIRVAVDEESERYNNSDDDDDDEEEEKPSVRAIVTAIFIMALVTQCTSISFFNDPDDQQIALSLLFSPFGVLARWRLSKLNKWRPTFPIGTFTCNLLACALSGSLGTLLAGSPGPEERIVLVSFIAGFGGTLSSLANFVVEILSGVDPILLRFDGMIYAVVSVGCAFVLGLIFTASVEWADQVGMDSEDEPVPMNDDAMSGMNATNETQLLFF